jgi:cell division transport system permease protein
MKAFRILSRNIRDSFKSVLRNFALSLASISCITITLIVVAIAIILTVNVNNFTKNIKEDVTIVVFLDNDITEDETTEVENSINNIVGVESYVYSSKEQIQSEMMESSKVFSSVMENWSDDESPLQATFEVKVDDINTIGEIANKIEALENVSLVKYGEGMVEQLVAVFNVVKNISIGTVVALILVTAFLITNTIKITIFSRKREIEIMRLVGASNINIKIPFLFEGLFLGLLGSIIPITGVIYGYTILYSYFGGQIFSPFIKLVTPQPFVFIVSLLLIVIGSVVGMFGSLKAVKKYLKI